MKTFLRSGCRRSGVIIATGSVIAATAAVLVNPPAQALNGFDITITNAGTGTVVDALGGSEAVHGSYYIKGASLGDVVTFTSASTNPGGAVAQSSGASQTATIVAGGVGTAANFSDVSGANLAPTNPQSLTLHTYTALASSGKPSWSTGPNVINQTYVDVGLGGLVAWASLAGTAYAQALIQFGTQQPSVSPTLSTTGTPSAGATLTLNGSHFWGTPITGDNTTASHAASVADPTILLDGVALTTAGASGSASTTATDVAADGNISVTGGVLTGSVTLPSTIAAGSHSIAVLQPNMTPYTQAGNTVPNTVAAIATFSISAPPPTVASAVASPAQGSNGQTINVSGDNWSPNQPVTLAFTHGTDTGTGTVDATGHMTGTITVNTPNEATGSNDIVVSQASSGFSASATFTVTGTVAGGPHQIINMDVKAGTLSDSQVGGDTSHVTLSPITLDGSVQHSTGDLNSVTVTDARGSLAGWSLNAQFEGDFTTAGADHNVIDASNLSATPSVVLASPGSGELSEVVAGAASALSKTTQTNLATAHSGGGGGSFRVDAGLDLKVPASIIPGTYSATLDITLG
jgi:hypothetical protein